MNRKVFFLLFLLVLWLSPSAALSAGEYSALHGPISLGTEQVYFRTALTAFAGVNLGSNDRWADEPFVIRRPSGIVVGVREGLPFAIRLVRERSPGTLEPIRLISDPAPVYQTMGKVSEGDISNGEGCSAHVEFWDSGNDNDDKIDVILVENTGSKPADITYEQGAKDETGKEQSESATEEVPPGGRSGTEVDENVEFVEVSIDC